MPVLFSNDIESLTTPTLTTIFSSVNGSVSVDTVEQKTGAKCLKVLSGGRAIHTLAANHDELYCGQWFKIATLIDAVNIGEYLSDSDTAMSLVLFTNGSIGVWRGSVFVTSATGKVVVNTYHFIEFYVLRHASTGRVKVWVDTELIIDYTGDTTGINNLRKYQWRSDSAMTCYVDDPVISQERIYDPPPVYDLHVSQSLCRIAVEEPSNIHTSQTLIRVAGRYTTGSSHWLGAGTDAGDFTY